MERNKEGRAWTGPLKPLSMIIVLIVSNIAITTAATCQPDLLDAQNGMNWEVKKGPYTYVQTSPASAVASSGDDTITSFSVTFTREASIHLQLWRKTTDDNFVLEHDQIFSAATAGLYELEVDWMVGEDEYWGFAYDGDDEVPIAYMPDSKVQAMGVNEFYGTTMNLDRSFLIPQDAPMLFNIKVCSDRMREGPGTRSSSTYSCLRKLSWDTASNLYPGQITFIDGRKITTPTSLLKDVEVQMESANFITIQIWRKDPANFEFLLVKEKTFYAKAGYNSIPVAMQMQYGDQWGFSLNSMVGNSIRYQNVTSDNSYFFPEFVSGVGSKRSYASNSPTPMEFKIAACLQVDPAQNAMGFPTQQGYAQTSQFYQPTQVGSSGSSSFGYNGQSSAYQSGPVNPASSNPVQYPNAYAPYGGAQQAFFPQASATQCYCKDNTFWYSAESTLTGPYTYIDPDAFTEQNANIEAFEIQAHLPGTVTLQIWRPAGPNMNAVYLVWDEEITLRPGYQRINLAHTVMAGDRWGFMSKSSDEVPVKFYEDQSSYGHEFQYQVSAATGQQLFLSSGLVSSKKFRIRPCLCSFMNGVASLGGGFPYYGAPQLTQSSLNSGINAYYGFGVDVQLPGSSQGSNNGGVGQVAPYPTAGYNSYGNNGYNAQVQYSNNGYSEPQCSGVEVDRAGLCPGCGSLEMIGPYTYINFNKLPRGRLESVDIFARNSGSIMLQIWRYDPQSNTIKVFYEKPVGLSSYPPMKTITVSQEVNENDMIGFSYLGSGVVPVQYSNRQGVKAFEDSMGRSKMSNGEINIPQGFSSKLFNMRACMASSSQQTQSNQYINSPYAQSQVYPNLDYSNQQNYYPSSGGMLSNSFNGYSSQQQNYQSSGTGTSQLSNSLVQMLNSFMGLLNNGYSIQQANQMGSTGSGSQSGAECQCEKDGESDGPFESKIKGPYTYVADFSGIRDKCISFIEYQASSFDDVFFFKARPKAGGKFEIVGEPVKSSPSSLVERTLLETDMCVGPNEKIGFFYSGSGNVPIRFTYSWGNSLELPLESPQNSIISQLYDTTKSFDIKVYVGATGSTDRCSMPGQASVQMNSNTQWNQYGSQSNVGMQGSMNYNSNYMGNNGYSSNNYQSGNNNYQSGYNNYQTYPMYQRAYYSPGYAMNPLLDQNPTQLSGPSCIGSPIDNRLSMGGYTGSLVYAIAEPFMRDGRLKNIDLESTSNSRIVLFQMRVDQQSGDSTIINAIEHNIYPGINSIPQSYVNWEIMAGDVIGFASADIVVPVTFTMDAFGNPNFNFNACLETSLYASPSTIQNPTGNNLPQSLGGGSFVGASTGDSCSCYDNSHWPFAFEEVFGPYTYINGEDFRQITGFVKAFELEAAIAGPVTLHIWRKSSPYSDRLTKIWSKDLVLRAGNQRIEGINTNIQEGDLWGFTFSQGGMVPINFVTDTNFFGYEIKDPAGVQSSATSVMYLGSANTGFKRFKIRPCVCSYGSTNNVNQVGSGFMSSPQIGSSYQQSAYAQGQLGGLSGYSTNNGQYQGYSQMNQQYPSYPQYSQQQTSFGAQGNIGFNPQPADPSLYTQYGQQAAFAPQYPTNSYQYCYGSLAEQGTLVKFGPYTHINFEPLPAGVIENIEFEATKPGTIKWYLWRQNPATTDFEVVVEKEITFQSGKQTIQFMEDTEDRDLIGFHYVGSDEIPIKFAENIGAQAYEDMSPVPPSVGTVILPPSSLEDKLFNYKLCMKSVTNGDIPLQTTSNIGGYGYTYTEQTAPYYASGPSFGQTPGFGPSPSPLPGYDYMNSYYPNPTYGISQYDPVQPYMYDSYQNPSSAYPTYGASTQQNMNMQGQYIPPGTPYGYNSQPYQSQYPSNMQQSQSYNAAYQSNYDMQGTGQYQGGYYY